MNLHRAPRLIQRVELHVLHKLCDCAGQRPRLTGPADRGDSFGADQKLDGGAKKQRRLPSGRLQRQ